MAQPSQKSGKSKQSINEAPTEAPVSRHIAAIDSCTQIAGMVAARVNDQLQRTAATLPPQQDDLTDMHFIPGSTSAGGSTSSPSRHASGNIQQISANIGSAALEQCLQRALGRGFSYEAIAKDIEAAGGPVAISEVEQSGLLATSRKTVGTHKAVSVPR